MSRLPIRSRLTLAFAVAMALVLAALGAFLHLRLGSSLDERIADDLESRSTALAAAVWAGEAAEIDPSLVRGEEGVAQVIQPDGTRLFLPADRVLTAEELELARRESLTIDRDGLRLRAVPVGDSVVVVGESLEDRDEALAALATQLLVALPLALVVSSAIGYLLAGAALSPVAAMRKRADEISAETLGRRLPLPQADDEIRDLGTTLNAMLDRLDASLERERRFVADASHELRTPLALLKTELELALRRPREPGELEDALHSAFAETNRLVELAEQLLLVSRADQGALAARNEPVEAKELVEEVADRCRARAAEAGRALEVAGEPASLRADTSLLEQALANLVDNAIRHGGGTVRLTVADRDGVVELHVLDEGEGFAETFLPHAFERFSRADQARRRGGTGLGLAIVDVIACAHGGSAHAANRPGGGADVWLALPKYCASPGSAEVDPGRAEDP
jgi:two-component system, OmpR family, sensor kinase